MFYHSSQLTLFRNESITDINYPELLSIEGTTGFPMEDSTGPPMEGSGNDMEDYEDSTPFQCNDQNLPGGSDKPSSKARSKSVLNLLLRYKHCSKYYKLT